ncbi:MAG TPA: PQQ-dependent sugar dehydrogenase [Solirubrobacterales bacterium]|nr:PQQ-dependent sugar dehydrogenase [Solirubrobacterales bacterium]
MGGSTRRASKAKAVTAAFVTALAGGCIVLAAAAASPDGSGKVTQQQIGSRGGGIAKHRIGSFDSPVYVTHAPGASSFLYVVQREGRIAALKNGRRIKGSFLDIHGRVSTSGERGLLSLAFDPRYQRNRLLYVYYTNADGNIEVDEFHAKSNRRVRSSSRRRVIVVPHPGHSNHNGGTLAFGPDGKLYLATGDGGGGGDPPENAQNRHKLLGKVLRISPHRRHGKPYGIPRGNPYAGKPGRNEIFAMGLRNPYRFSFDRGRILIGDVGQSNWEEVDYASRKRLRGANFGWDHYEGDHRFDYPGDNEARRPKRKYRPPILEYSHSGPNCASFGGCAITGGVVVRDRGLPGLRGRYLYADFYRGQLRSLVPHRPRARRDRAVGIHIDHPSSFGTGARNHVYVTSLDGPVYRLLRK